jgi:hypothetical protein
MSSQETQPHEFSTGRGNFLTVMLDLVRGQTRVLDDAEAAREAADAARRQAHRGDDLLTVGSSAL